MKKRYWLTLITIVVIIQLIFNQLRLGANLQLILVFAWLTSFYFDAKVALVYVSIAGFIFEILTFNEVGIHGLSFSVGILFVFFAWKYMNFSDNSYRGSLNTIGLLISAIVFFVLKFFYIGELNILSLIISIIIDILIFLFFSKIVGSNSTNRL